MSICRYKKGCDWYIFQTIEKAKRVFYIYHIKNETPIVCSLKDLKILVKEVSEDLNRYK